MQQPPQYRRPKNLKSNAGQLSSKQRQEEIVNLHVTIFELQEKLSKANTNISYLEHYLDEHCKDTEWRFN